MMLMQGQFRLDFTETSNVFPLVFLERISGIVPSSVEIIVDAKGNATISGANLIVDSKGHSTLTGGTLTVDQYGNAMVA